MALSKTRALRQHAAAVRQRRHYAKTRQAHLDFLTAAVMLFHEARSLGLGIQLSQPEYREFRRRLLDAEDCETAYLALRMPRIVKVVDLPPDPSYHGPERPQEWLHACDHCHKPFTGGYRSESGTTNFCDACLNILDSEGA